MDEGTEGENMGRSKEILLQEMRRAAARGHRAELERGTVKSRPVVRFTCPCGWAGKWKPIQSHALAAMVWHISQVGQEDPLWAGQGIDDMPDVADIPQTVRRSL
jgi:hypothetical protein